MCVWSVCKHTSKPISPPVSLKSDLISHQCLERYITVYSYLSVYIRLSIYLSSPCYMLCFVFLFEEKLYILLKENCLVISSKYFCKYFHMV